MNASTLDNITRTVVLIEDDPAVCNKLAATINQATHLELLFSGPTVKEGIEAVVNLHPDILLTDLGLLDGSGIEIIQAIQKQRLDTNAIVVTGFQDEHLVFAALKAGAKGYILKNDTTQNIIDSIDSMIAGGAPISPIIAKLLLTQFDEKPQSAEAPEILTGRQIKILELVSQGFSSKEIAERLSISYHTVTTHIKNIYEKLQVNSRTQALHEAFKRGLISDPGH